MADKRVDIAVDYWDVAAPPAQPAIGTTCLVNASPTAGTDFVGLGGCVAKWNGVRWEPTPKAALKGRTLSKPDGTQWTHDGSAPAEISTKTYADAAAAAAVAGVPIPGLGDIVGGNPGEVLYCDSNGDWVRLAAPGSDGTFKLRLVRSGSGTVFTFSWAADS